jgi:putative ABC transport system permease protein
MLAAIVRTTRANLRSRVWQSLLAGLIVAAAAATMTLALDVRRGADAPFDRIFSATHGPHVVAVGPPSEAAELSRLARLPGVEATTAVEPAGVVPARIGSSDVNLLVAERQDANVAVDRLLLRRGRFPSARGEVLVENSYARNQHLAPGDVIRVRGVALRVSGTATTTERGPYPRWSPGLVWVQRETFAAVQPHVVQLAIGLRLSDAGAAQTVADQVRRQLGPRGGAWTYADIRKDVSEDSRSAALVLEAFSLFALITVGLILANTIGGRVLAQGRQIAICKAVGCTPRMVAAMLLTEQLAIGLAGAIVGAAIGTAVAPLFLSRTADLLATTAPTPLDPAAIGGSIALTLLVVVVFTLLPAWRGGRLSVVRGLAGALSGVRPRPSRVARLAARLRFSPSVVVGVKDAFARRPRAALTVASLAVTMGMVVAALSMEATYARVINDPALRAKPYDLMVVPANGPADRVPGLLARQRGVEGWFTISERSASTPGLADPLTTRALGGDYRRHPYAVPDGRMLQGPGEAIVGRGLLSAAHLHVGDPLTLRTAGRSVTVRIVGRYVEPDDDARTAIVDERTYERAGIPVSDRLFGVELRSGTDAHAVGRTLTQATGGKVQAIVTADDVESERSSFRGIVYGLDAVLLLIGLANLLTTLTLLVRERAHDFGVFKTLGLTPRQVVVAVTAGGSVLALLAAVVGIPVGYVAFREIAIALNPTDGPDVITAPPLWWLIVLVPVAVGLAAAASALPARTASRLSVAEVLRYE